MKEIRLTRDFLKNPFNSVFILLGMVVLIESIGWSVANISKLKLVNKAGGALNYIGLLIKDLFIPELCTLLITIALINLFHQIGRLHIVENTWRSIYRYELRFLPILAGAFWVFDPVTQTVRYFLEKYPDYSWARYWNDYILYTFNWSTYFKYLAPIIFIGYSAINISLLKDYLKQRRETAEAAEAEAAEVLQKALALSAPKSTVPSPYLTHLKGRDAFGELVFPVSDIYYFTIEDRFYYAELAKGRYLISKTLNELEAELNPTQFLRIKRDYIINRQAIESYAHWENGKYNIRLNTPKPQMIVVPRNRMQELKEWLQHVDSRPLEMTS